MEYKYEILAQLNKIKGKDRNRLHMPGHKNLGDFRSQFPVAPIDLTELNITDDLSCPSGAIKKAQQDLAEITGAKRAYITTDGSSSGVMVMLFVAAAYGNKIIVPRSSHKSVFNACRLLNLEPVIVQGVEENGVLTPPPADLIETLVVNDVNIAGMIITSPDYYGNIAPLDAYAEILKKYGRLLLVDGAHGSHLVLNEGREGYAGVYADMWVDGVHKSLPVLTQGALLCVNDEKLITRAEEGLSIFRTTSPSFPIMASVEYGVKYFINNPKYFARALNLVNELKAGLEGISVYPSGDWTKFAVDFKPLGISPYLAEEIFKKKGIYPEFNDGRYILFYLSPSVEPFHINEFKNTLLWVCAQKKLQNTYKELPPVPAADRTYSFLYAYRQKTEWVPLKQAAGRMCADNAGITPPCLPVVIAGEMISQQAVDVLLKAHATFGVVDGKIKVVKK
ncbi:MAG: aminotransferase class I/II-fold pyridoxal phosphate-dependent enzyme [Clostridiales bacterium]|nr:aminotransferase class I/II-fold pyridoxal phosphate-dependent enzyme [Clostridiales bacterium]